MTKKESSLQSHIQFLCIPPPSTTPGVHPVLETYSREDLVDWPDDPILGGHSNSHVRPDGIR